MKRLWIADVHANLPAFEAVLADAGTVDETVFLGDIVGLGPHPGECVDLLRQLDAKAIRGNHDTTILNIKSSSTQRAVPVDWNEWTRDQLNASQLSFLASLPHELSVESDGVTIQVMHHPAKAPYMHPDMPDAVLARQLHAIQYPVVFCGHSHRAMDRSVNGCRYVCIPPIGQPRNRDPRAGYAIEDGGTLTFRYVTYDVERVASDIQNIGLHEEFCQRWLSFLRTGFDAEWSREYKKR